MPRSGDAYLTGSLKATHDPNKRIPWHVPKGDPAAAASDAVNPERAPIFKNLFALITGRDDADLGHVGGWFANLRDTIDTNRQEHRDALVNKLSGWKGKDWPRSVAEQALKDQAETTAALSAAVQALQNNYNNASNGGVSAFVDFSLRADATSLGSDFTQYYTGSGTGQWGIFDGGATWYAASDADRQCVAVYNAEGSTSDYQMVGVAFASSPMYFNSSTQARNRICARMNAAGTDYVYVDFGKNDAELGCVVGGVKHLFATNSGSFSFQSNAMYWLRCGTLGGLRKYQVLQGNTPIRFGGNVEYTEVGTTSQVGEDPANPGTFPWRYTGMRVSARASNLGTTFPGDVLAFGFSDNLPPVFVGSYAKMYRTNAGTVAMASGQSALPSAFFDNADTHTEDLTPNLPNGSWTVSNAGNYRCTIHSKISGPPNQFSWQLYINGSPAEYAGDSFVRGVGILGGNETPSYAGGSVDVPLNPGDVVSWGTDAGGFAASALTGEALGKGTYFTITLINRSLS